MSDKFIPAATVLIVRDTPSGVEVFMVVRHHEIDFASGALVFPGGKVDAGDFDAGLRDYCPQAQNLSDDELAFRVAGVRESYEECGILLARKRGANAFITAAQVQALESWRDRFNNRDACMLDFAREAQLDFAVDALAHFGHWKTPEMMKKRFDTHFFLIRAPQDHIGIHDGSESVDSVWITPRTALADAEAGTRTIIFPTRMNIQKLAQAADVEAAIAACGDVVTVQPFIEKDGDKVYLRIQANAGYGDPREDVTRGL
ncbi:MAG: NUDIX hydrolase [Alphaproteobacteria bacterium]|nr:NUDIX hydrolase [Alphaproteobacteria bacterium]MBE8220594.1 NUDIX hydrolase [Alphaproteobacteria bacterium]